MLLLLLDATIGNGVMANLFPLYHLQTPCLLALDSVQHLQVSIAQALELSMDLFGQTCISTHNKSSNPFLL